MSDLKDCFESFDMQIFKPQRHEGHNEHNVTSLWFFVSFCLCGLQSSYKSDISHQPSAIPTGIFLSRPSTPIA
jgi:hypothetical protein